MAEQSAIPSARAPLPAEARSYFLAHLVGGAAGLAAAICWAVLGHPDSDLEWLTLTWLASPLALAWLAGLGAPIRPLQAASTVNAILVLTLLAALTGGPVSLFVPWLVLVPAEAALSRRPIALISAFIAGAAAIAALALVSAAGVLPRFDLPGELSALLMAASLAGCLLYSGLLAMSVARVHAHAAHVAAESEASYRFLADNAADLVLRLTSGGRVLYASQAARAIAGRARDTLAGTSFLEIVHKDDVTDAQRAIMRAAYFGDETAADCRIVMPSGDMVWTELKCRGLQEPVRSSLAFGRRRRPREAKGMDVIAIARDVTRRHNNEEELKSAARAAAEQSQAKSQFLANMSHELRTPLNSILGFSEMMSKQVFGPLGHARYEEYAALIGESGRYLLELINDILDVSKIESGKYTLALEPLDLGLALERTLKLIRPQFREKGVELQVLVPAGLPPALADARAVRQMLFNLLSNALKFTPKEGRVTARIGGESGLLVLEVADTGIGIRASDLKRLARPFEQAGDPQVRAEIGTGLGLSLVRALTELHGGSLTIRSKLGRGTSVIVRLKQAVASAAPEVSAAA